TFADTPGAGSLRDAIVQANNAPGDSTISLGAGAYTLSAAAGGELLLSAAPHTITILGAGAGLTVINARGANRALEGNCNFNVVLENLYITEGLGFHGGTAGMNAGLGGGLLNNGGVVTLDGVAVTGNRAQGPTGGNGLGGGVFSSGQLTIDNCSITNNQAIG